jgi:hypothetical protein
MHTVHPFSSLSLSRSMWIYICAHTRWIHSLRGNIVHPDRVMCSHSLLMQLMMMMMVGVKQKRVTQLVWCQINIKDCLIVYIHILSSKNEGIRPSVGINIYKRKKTICIINSSCDRSHINKYLIWTLLWSIRNSPSSFLYTCGRLASRHRIPSVHSLYVFIEIDILLSKDKLF